MTGAIHRWDTSDHYGAWERFRQGDEVFTSAMKLRKFQDSERSRKTPAPMWRHGPPIYEHPTHVSTIVGA